MLPHPLTNLEIQKYYQNEPKFNVYSKINLPKIKDGTNAINLDEYILVGTNWIALYVTGDAIYFDSFGVEQLKIKKFIGNRNITKNFFRVQAYNSNRQTILQQAALTSRTSIVLLQYIFFSFKTKK